MAEKILENQNIFLKLNPLECNLFTSKKHYVFSTQILTHSPIQTAELGNFSFDDKLVVVKLFNDKIKDVQERWNKEIQNYQLLSQLYEKTPLLSFHLPKRLLYVPGLIIYELIDGTPLEEFLISAELTNEILQKFAQGLCVLHLSGLAYGDQRLRNFIYAYSQIFCIDYEDITNLSQVSLIDDFSKFMAVFLDSRSMIFEFYQELLKTHALLNTWIDYLLQFFHLYGDSIQDFIKSESSFILNPNFDFLPCPSEWRNSQNWCFWIEKIILSLSETAQRRGIDFSIMHQQKIREFLQKKYELNG
jgi:hypothetical protein